MTTHFTFRRQVALLAGLSLLVSMFVIAPGATNAQSTDPAPDYLATFEACPEDVIPSSDFTDVRSNHENAQDIDCIAYYGITMGTSATTYSPEDPVIREHMALFLVRLARLVGIGVPAQSRTPFIDIGSLRAPSQEAISQIYQLGITVGTSANTYDPARDVSRGEMALFLKRLMNLIDPIETDDQAHGYIPEDVEDEVLEDADVDSPYTDLQDSTFAVYEAVTQLYELGVGSGVSGRAYGPSIDMSRAAMAEFMADILDHSNLRPEGVTVELIPAQGWEDYEVTALVSVRDDEFLPLDEESVDWFYTDDEDGGLASNGTCDLDLILDGDCEWSDNEFYETGDDGNFTVKFSAIPGKTLTFYAWVGRTDGDEFDEDSESFGKSEARSDMGVAEISITSNISSTAATLTDTEEYDTHMVDLDRVSAVTFRAQLEDIDGNRLRREGIEVEIDVDRTSGLLDADAVTPEGVIDVPTPSFSPGSNLASPDTVTVLTDRNGVVTFRLTSPASRSNREDDRLDVVTFNTTIADDCCTAEIGVAWSEADPVLVQALPTIDSYRFRSRDDVRVSVRYRLYDQYGNAVRSTTGGRENTTLMGMLEYYLYPVSEEGVVGNSTEDVEGVTISNGVFSRTLDLENLSEADDYLLVVTPQIFSRPTGGNDIPYVSLGTPVWIVRDAEDRAVLPSSNFDVDAELLDNRSRDVSDALKEVEINAASNEFRTFFTVWEYDSNDDFLYDGEDITLSEFEDLFAIHVDSVGDIDVVRYFDTSSRRSEFEIIPPD